MVLGVVLWRWPMARLGRYFLPNQSLHAIQRGNNRQAIFFGEEWSAPLG